MEYRGNKNLYAAYYADASSSKFRVLSKSYLNTLWQKVMRNGVTDPATGVHFKTFVRTCKARGFSKCDTCELLKAKIRAAKTTTKRCVYAQKLDNHYSKVSDDRAELARVTRCPPPSCSCFPSECAGSKITFGHHLREFSLQ